MVVLALELYPWSADDFLHQRALSSQVLSTKKVSGSSRR